VQLTKEVVHAMKGSITRNKEAELEAIINLIIGEIS